MLLARELVAVVAGVLADVLELEADPRISTAAQSHSQLSHPFLGHKPGSKLTINSIQRHRHTVGIDISTETSRLQYGINLILEDAEISRRARSCESRIGPIQSC